MRGGVSLIIIIIILCSMFFFPSPTLSSIMWEMVDNGWLGITWTIDRVHYYLPLVMLIQYCYFPYVVVTEWIHCVAIFDSFES